ncbi:PQQ-binding-like beta-propeller repeat protein [Teredinibacter purpureus]|uniref:PQQ-binding-like beta-propeller repeat protein n=1 Tax=Teredinibacter purpureus TaxID=2731756 RepID=UPI0006969F3D|nr:PQQ-binding-like beta-propeller repeat protein [Teredinibacter purpureus]
MSYNQPTHRSIQFCVGVLFVCFGLTAQASDTLDPNERLYSGDYLLSNNGNYRATLQGDSNLVVRSTADGTVVWSSGTKTDRNTYFTMQGNGNLVQYNLESQAIWSTGTGGNSGAKLVLEDDGNLVIYDSNNNEIWALETNKLTGRLNPGQKLTSENNKYILTMQLDGNVVLRRTSDGKALWSTATNVGKAFLSMQNDGNLVVYRTNGTALWASNTNDSSGLYVILKNDGDLDIKNASNTTIWSTNSREKVCTTSLVRYWGGGYQWGEISYNPSQSCYVNVPVYYYNPYSISIFGCSVFPEYKGFTNRTICQ